MKKMLNEGNQIHIYTSSSGSGTVNNLTSYGSGSASQKVKVPTVPVPQRCHRLQQSTVHKITVPLKRRNTTGQESLKLRGKRKKVTYIMHKMRTLALCLPIIISIWGLQNPFFKQKIRISSDFYIFKKDS
jgi:hypothetical protein